MVRIDKEWATSAIGAVSSSPLACSDLTSTRAATTEAERLKIGDFIRAALVSRCDVVHFQGAFIRRNPAQLATKLGIFEDFKPESPVYETRTAPTVGPNHVIPTSTSVSLAEGPFTVNVGKRGVRGTASLRGTGLSVDETVPWWKFWSEAH